MKTKFIGSLAALVTVCTLSPPALADLVPAGIWNGTVGLSVDGIGGNGTGTIGNVQASIPVTATVLQAYLYSAGTPYPFYANSPQTLADYNNAGITLAGQAVNNFDTLVGATSTRADIGQWFTARADVTTLVQSLLGGGPDYSWAVGEGSITNRLDGEILAIVYSDASLAVGSVALLDGGQNTSGETTNVFFGSPLDTSSPTFAAELGLGISFSCCGQASNVSINGNLLSSNAGNFDDGLDQTDGSLITVGGLGDTASNLQSYANDGELYDLSSFLNTGDTSFSLFTSNPTNDDNIFFASLYLNGEISGINNPPPPGNPVPAPGTLLLMAAGLGLMNLTRRNKKI
jgi:hypothetical protein